MSSIGSAGCYRWRRENRDRRRNVVASISREAFIVTVNELSGRVKHVGNEVRILKNGSLLTDEFSILDGEFVNFLAGDEVELQMRECWLAASEV